MPSPSLQPLRARAWLAELAVEWLLAAGLLFAMDALAHLKLTVMGFVGVLGGWLVAGTVSACLRRRWPTTGIWPGAVELGLPLLWLALGNAALKQPWTLPQMIYAVALVTAGWRGWRWQLSRAAAKGIDPTGERLRQLLVGGAALLVMMPFFTDRQVGGSDATWYTGVFTDFTQQLRAGTFPVFIGQGELSFNGSVNLFRSAPLCLWLGGLGDVLTWQSLSPVAVRHLSLLLAALGAALGMYAAQVRLLPFLGAGLAQAAWARWLAALGALIYILSPGILVPLYAFELQMTFTALLALPWIFHGNMRVLLGRNDGYPVLAVGLALAWLAHVPLAIIATLSTAVLQFGHFIFTPEALRQQGLAALRGAALFGLLSAYYFLGMSEVETGQGGSLRHEAGHLLGVLLVVVAAVRGLYFRQWPWLAAGLAGVGLVAWAAPVWVPWVVSWTLLWAAVVGIWRWSGAPPDGARAVWLAAGTMLGAAALAQVWIAGRGFVPNDHQARELAYVMAERTAVLQPLAAKLGRYSDCQPGYTVLALVAWGLAASWWSRSRMAALLAAVAGLLVVMLLAVPLAANFLVGFAPAQIGNLVNLPMLYRLGPPLVAIGVMGGFVLLIQAGAPGGWRRWTVIGALAVGTAWSGWEARRIPSIGLTRTASRAATEKAFSPDNFRLGRYSYLMLYTPRHYADGRQTPWMNSRLLNAGYTLITGPDQIARQMEAAQERVALALSSTIDPSYPEWRQFTPTWEVQPGETLLLRFEFDPGSNCAGWLILSSERCYQEHELDPAFEGYGFGAGPYASRTIAVTNSGPHVEHFTMRMKTGAGNNLPTDGGTWGKVHISRYDPDAAPLKIESLRPYRARVVMPERGFLETPRQWLAGYRATVDGVPVAPVRLPSGMLGVPLAAGRHDVVVKFTGSARLWLGLGVSFAAALGVLVTWLGGDWRKWFKATLSPQ